MNKFTKLFALGLVSLPVIGSAQVNVSATVSKRVAVVEEFTGNYCTFCPLGHKIIQEISDARPGLVLPIKIQYGGFSSTDPIFGGSLSTTHGNAIAVEHASTSYPNMKVNRQGSSIDGATKSEWEAGVDAIIVEDSPVNLYATATVDVAARTMDVSVEYYYTANEANATNYLHIGYYQDNVPAYQYASNSYYPDHVIVPDVELYEFDHCFKENITGTWGEAINATTVASTAIVNKTTVALPSGFNGFDIHAGAIKVFAYISTSEKGEILTGIEATTTYTNFPNTEDVELIYISSAEGECPDVETTAAPTAVFTTFGENDLTSLDVDYGINGGTDSDSWTGTLKHNNTAAIELGATAFTTAASNTISVTLDSPNGTTDGVTSNNAGSVSFDGGKTGETNITLDIVHDNYGDEVEWEIKNGSNVTVASGGPYEALGGNSWMTETLDQILPALDGDDCYTFTLTDGYGDGMGPNTSVTMKDGSGKTLFTIEGGDYTTEINKKFAMVSVVSAKENTVSNLEIYPNPTNGIANVEFNVASSSNVTVNVINTLGQVVLNNNLGLVNGAQKVNINGNNLDNGIYFVNIKIGDKTTTQKLTVSK